MEIVEARRKIVMKNWPESEPVAEYRQYDSPVTLMSAPAPLRVADEQLSMLLAELAPRLSTSKSELVSEIESRLSRLLGIDIYEAFSAVAAAQRHVAPSLNLDRAHKSALVLLAHVLSAMEESRNHDADD